MAVKLSTGLRNALLNNRTLRQVFEDSIIKIYTGTAPSTADDAETGTLLVTISKASGTVSVGEVSVAKQAKLQITSHAGAETFTVTINGTTYTYVNTPDLDAAGVAGALALLCDADPLVLAMASGTDTIYFRSRVKGLTFTITKGGTGTSTLGDDTVANSRSDALQFGDPATGIISKASEVWSGVCVASGTAGYFRIVQSSDTGISSATQVRLQGNVATSGQEMTLSSTSLVSGATQTIDAAAITEPAS
jgi:hypothetical protein